MEGKTMEKALKGMEPLIAAAPDMLAALRTLEWRAGNHAAGLIALGYPERAKSLADACDAARAAIAKAEGR